ncbi:MAG TPA: hypothetical protein PK668_13595 [Myxococcota bacterium]|nr:hypothetical protein [Myxococcota bacterium]HRY94104.1 hypothetical protein [Myxococcota bacterium]
MPFITILLTMALVLHCALTSLAARRSKLWAVGGGALSLLCLYALLEASSRGDACLIHGGPELCGLTMRWCWVSLSALVASALVCSVGILRNRKNLRLSRRARVVELVVFSAEVCGVLFLAGGHVRALMQFLAASLPR